jgi:hypothetical protein
MRTRPDLVEQLFHAFPTDRRGEVPEGTLPWFDIPVFNWHAGQLTTIYVGQYIRSAQKNFPLRAASQRRSWRRWTCWMR